ncbi:MAG: hypothetical protein M3O25_11940 [Actinomycetota bacterium]|nr:hypothetical protein [Actinomycetota bacterium]
MAFLDEEDQQPAAQQPDRPRRPDRPSREVSRPQRRRQQYLIRRLIGVGVGVGVLILLVIGVRGCLEARSDRGLSTYTQSVGTIMQESQVRGEEFFDALEDENLTDQQLEDQISSVRSASSSLLDRAENVSAPDQMREAQSATTQALRLRRDALEQITANIGNATADAETADGITVIAQQMGALYASDILWAQLAVPEIQQVLEDDQVEAQELPPGNFMPANDPTKYLDETEIVTLISGGSSDAATGVRGLELVQVTVGDTTLSPDAPTTVADDAREILVQVNNGGEQVERAVQVNVTFGDQEISEPIPQIEPGATEEAALPLETVPQPGTELTIEVIVEPVPGEQVSDNNQATYTVIFGSA